MKKILFISLFLLQAVFMSAGQMPIGEITAREYINSNGQMADKKAVVKYDAKNKTTYIYFEDVNGDYAIVLNVKTKNEFLTLCKKFFEIADGQTGDDNKKQARLGVITTSLYFDYAEKWYMSKPDVPVFLNFLPQQGSVYDLAISFGRAVSMKNKSIQYSPSDRYIAETELRHLVEMFSAEDGQKN